MRNHLIPILLATIVISGCALAVSNDPAHANQSGPNVNDQIWGWGTLCVMHGGTTTIDFHPGSGADVSCKGGRLGGLVCFLYNNPTKSWCDQGKASTASAGAWAASGIDPATLPLIVEVPVAQGVINVDPNATPQVFDALVAWPATTGGAQGLMVAEVHACKLGGGDATAMTRLPDTRDSLVIRCGSGVFAGHTCDLSAGMAMCFTDTAPLPTSPVIPATAPASMTEEPAKPTPLPSETAAPESTLPPTSDPTSVPTIQPTPSPTAADPWTVPEGTLPILEPVEPTPTEVILS